MQFPLSKESGVDRIPAVANKSAHNTDLLPGTGQNSGAYLSIAKRNFPPKLNLSSGDHVNDTAVDGSGDDILNGSIVYVVS